MVNPDLKPCPFCGEQPSPSAEGDGCCRTHFVRCSCGARGPFEAAEAAAIAAWNARAETQSELLEAIKLRDLYRSRLCQTCLGTRRLHIIDGCTQPAHDIDCPTCVGIGIGGFLQSPQEKSDV